MHLSVEPYAATASVMYSIRSNCLYLATGINRRCHHAFDLRRRYGARFYVGCAHIDVASVLCAAVHLNRCCLLACTIVLAQRRSVVCSYRPLRSQRHIRKVNSCQPTHSVMSSCQASAPAHAPTHIAAPERRLDARSPIEEQLQAQHQQPAELLPLHRQNSSLLIDDNIALLDNLTRSTTVTSHEAGGVVLGFSVANGAVAMQDFPVGTVRKHCLIPLGC